MPPVAPAGRRGPRHRAGAEPRARRHRRRLALAGHGPDNQCGARLDDAAHVLAPRPCPRLDRVAHGRALAPVGARHEPASRPPVDLPGRAAGRPQLTGHVGPRPLERRPIEHVGVVALDRVTRRVGCARGRRSCYPPACPDPHAGSVARTRRRVKRAQADLPVGAVVGPAAGSIRSHHGPYASCTAGCVWIGRSVRRIFVSPLSSAVTSRSRSLVITAASRS